MPLPLKTFILCVLLYALDSQVDLHAQSCTCTDFVYLNDTGGPLNMVEKFGVDPITGALSEIGDSQNGTPWLIASNLVDSPHGIAADLNGYLYIGERDANSGQYNIQKFNCNGEKVDADLSTPAIDNFTDDGYSYSHFAVGNYLYANIFYDEFNGYNEVRIYDLCTGDLVGCQAPASLWGLTEGTDGYWYGSGWTPVDPVTGAWGPGIVRGLIDPTSFTDGNGGCGALSSWMTADELSVPGNSQVQGVAQDNDGNIYAVVSAGGGFWPPSYITKVATDGTITTSLVDSSIEANPNDNLNWAGARGVVWSPSSGLLYVSSGDDCIAAFDTDLNYIQSAGVNITGSFPKQIGLLTECCPNPSNLTIDTIFCNVPSYPSEIYLQDLFACPGTICEGQWAPDPNNSGMTYNDCDNSILINTDGACGTFSLSSDGSSPNSICGAFTITINIETATIAAATITEGATICAGNNAPTLSANSPTPDVTYQWQLSNTSCSGPFTNINGANGNVYTPNQLSSTTYYRVQTSKSGNCTTKECSVLSNCTEIAVESCCPPQTCLSVTVVK